ncbi:glycosyltransferase [Pseudomonas sp. WOUb67]|uniref:glycosyltransferase n=1 Tax=Pseudomonas sp. WOUb67 TaxID=3161136 RepID=UPI003CEF5207
MKIALLADAFSSAAFSLAADETEHLHPDSFEEQILNSSPDILLVESAWLGQDGAWQKKLAPPGKEILKCLELCKSLNIPTVFWNKEDPVHFGTFIALARFFDHVFTTDIDCIPRYKKALGHDRVSLLPFGVQPKLHNPLNTIERQNAFCFAGSWYQRYPDRQKEFRSLVDSISKIGRLDIYDRNHLNEKSETQFPPEYTPLIKGFLPFSQIDLAYKGYRFAVNINTVTQSQSMFARRVYELMGSNSLVVSNPSKGMQLFFGDLIISSPDTSKLEDNISSAWHDETCYRKQRLMALRKVLSEHTYTHRLQYIKARINGERWQPAETEVLILAIARSAEGERCLIENIKRQRHPCRSLILRTYKKDDSQPAQAQGYRITIHTETLEYKFAVQAALREHSWLASFVSDDFYGPHYLTDLTLATQFTQANAIGKRSFFSAKNGGCDLIEDGLQYRHVDRLFARSAIMLTKKLPTGWLNQYLQDMEGAVIDWPSTMLATDEFQYCHNGAQLPPSILANSAGDLPLNSGLSLAKDILPIAERLSAADYRQPIVSATALQITGETLYDWLKPRLPEAVTLELQGDSLLIISQLEHNKCATLYAANRFSRSDINLFENNQVRLISEHNLTELNTLFEFENPSRTGIGHTINSAGAAYSLILPDNCHFLRIALRIQGPGTALIHSLVLGRTFEASAFSLEKCVGSLEKIKQDSIRTFVRSGASPVSLTNRAQAAFLAGQYDLAIGFYKNAMLEQPGLAHLYQLSIDIAERRLGNHTEQAKPSHATSLQLSIDSLTNNGHTNETSVALNEIYNAIAKLSPKLPKIATSHAPLVSVVLTTENDAEFVEQAVDSVLRQSWANLELIVVDNASTDQTWKILDRLRKTVGHLFCYRLNTNLGKSFARNLALQKARGDFLFFQSGNELSHPERICLSMHYLLQPGVNAIMEGRAKLLTPSNRVIAAAPDKYISDTLPALSRTTFEHIGYFGYFGNSSADEFNLRLNTWASFEGSSIPEIEHPLVYQALVDELIAATPCQAGALQINDNRVAHCKRSREAFAQLHQELGAERFQEFFRFPVIRDLIPVPPALSSLANPAQPVVVSLCSIPERTDLLRQVLASLAPQVDALHIYLDRYDSIPDFVRDCHPQVTVYLSKDHPGLRDNGKFLAFSALAEDCYYFTADDDIVYPPDYVASMVRRIEDYERQAVIGVHGVLLPEQAEGYFTSFRKVHMFKKELERDALVNNLGTGTVAFHSGLLRGLDLTHFGTPGMADLHLSVFCKQRDIPMVALARPEDWLQELPSPNTSLYNEFRQADDQQSALIRAHKPWGYAAISKAVAVASTRATKPDTGERLQRLIPILHACLK